MSDTTSKTPAAVRPFTVTTASALLSGDRALSRDVLSRAVATADTGDVTIALVAYAIRERTIAGEADGTASIGALARAMTVDTPDRVKSVRSTLSKRASVVGTILRANLDVPTHYRPAFLAYDSTADGRKILRDGVETLHAAGDTLSRDDRSARFLAICDQARATKSAARTTREARPNDGTNAAATDAPDAAGTDAPNAAGTRVTWAESIAIAAAHAASATDALDLDALHAVGANVAALADAIADAIARKSAAADAHARKASTRRR